MTEFNFTFMSPTFELQDVFGVPYKFFPISIRSLVNLSSLAKPLMQALTVIFRNEETDTGYLSKKTRGGGEDVFSKQALEPELAKLRSQEKERAFERLVDAVTSPVNAKALARLIMDSCREQFPRTLTDANVEEFVNNTDVEAWTAFLTGLIKANKRVFDPFLKGPLGVRVSASLSDLVPEVEKVEKVKTAETPVGSNA